MSSSKNTRKKLRITKKLSTKCSKVSDNIDDKKPDIKNTIYPEKLAVYHPEGAYGFAEPPAGYEYIFIH